MSEPPRDPVDFSIMVVRRNGSAVDVTDAVIDAYDIAVGSMDFGSGFLSTEEVGNLRMLGKAIGATRFDYQHDRCLRCGEEYDRHRTTPDFTRVITTGDVRCAGYVAAERD